jgi:protein-disulfide isomerase
VGAGDPGPIRDTDLVTIKVRRVHVQFAVVLLLGFVLGYGAARLRDRSLPQPLSTRSQGSVSDGALSAPTAPIRVDVAGRPARGPERAAVTLVEFTDYQCPYCARYFTQTYDTLLAANAGHLRYVVRNFPVTSLHPNAQKAAEAVECAFEQGRFWEYHNALFKRSPRFPLDTLKAIAAHLGLNTARFDDCLDSGKKEPVVRRDIEDGRHYGVQGTPTFFINGRIIVGAQPITVFQAEIDRALQDR